MEPTTSSSEVFTYLIEHIPVWLKSLSGVARSQRDYSLRRSSHIPSGGTQSTSKSVEAVNPENGKQQIPALLISEAPLPQQSQALDGERKSVASDDPSLEHARNRYRAQNFIQVQFDGSAQQQLQVVVNGITDALELIRKSRRVVPTPGIDAPGGAQWQAAWTKSSSKGPGSNAKPSSSEGRREDLGYKSNGKEDDTYDDDDDDDDDDNEDDNDDDDDLDKDALMAKIRMRPGRTNVASEGHQLPVDKKRVLDSSGVDWRLEKAQERCYAAAYQLLRDGDCSNEAGEASDALEQIFAVLNRAQGGSS